MNVDSRISYDQREDKIYGPHSKVQVVMARGLQQKWKQIAYYDFDCQMTEDILCNIIVKLSASGFKFQNYKLRGHWVKKLITHKMHSSCAPANFEWSPLDPVEADRLHIGEEYAIIILNRPIKVPGLMMIDLWNNAKLRITVDRGTDRWLDYCKQLRATHYDDDILNPDLVSGDLDSLDPSTLEHVRSLGCEVYETPDQNQTDFEKAVVILLDKCIKINSILVVSEHSGRLDHTISNLNVHFSLEKLLSRQNICMYHLAGDSLTWLLKPGKHTIKIPKRLRDHNVWCSVLPVGFSCHVSSSGLKFNMNNALLEFGGLISSSNTYDGEKESVELSVDANIIWSMGLGFEKD